ncbi:MAG: reverse transcriptase domain-containing protein, partial [Anaplasma sp.]|nr:reverse transcriptase domain-containing protein [Anaplasma sp.]
TNKDDGRGSVHTIFINGKNVAGEELANILNYHFINVCASRERKTDREISVRNTTTNISSSVMLEPTCPSEVSNLIKNIKTSVAAGADEIKPLPVKIVSHIISPILAHILNNMMQTGIFPDELKVAKVSAVHKGGNKNDLEKYRPISVLPIFSKIFEGVINTRLQKFFTKYNVITGSQYGFQKDKSTELALTNIKDSIITNIENKLYTLGLFLDLSKAFD